MNARYLAQEKQRLQQEKIILEQQRKLEEERLKREWAALQDTKQRQQAGIAILGLNLTVPNPRASGTSPQMVGPTMQQLVELRFYPPQTPPSLWSNVPLE
ncbi:Hypp4372 [Branchiostoma lanceolatum]|uniref:Hypp4372 protein n=1 Tax=Branchiostoma lanceolatum TaxID=7740 RepID=A0A8K0AAZ0_BRALA|nr:Hypp4372 [Branchiostoma lanceolatum]